MYLIRLRRQSLALAICALAFNVSSAFAASSPGMPNTDNEGAWKSYLSTMVEPDYKPTAKELSEGRQLSLTHCAVCHARPEPDALPKASWVESFSQLVRLFAPLKIIDLKADRSPTPKISPGRGLAQPSSAYHGYRITKNEFSKAAAYYIYSAPRESLPIKKRPSASNLAAPFKVKKLVSARPGVLEYYPLASYDAYSKHFVLGRLLGTFNKVEGRFNLLKQPNANALLVVDHAGQAMKEIPLSGTPTGLTRQPDGIYVTLMGSNPFPGPEAEGKLVRLPSNAFDKRMSGTIKEQAVITKLRRPVRTAFADFDSDGKNEMLVEEFGFTEGGLSIFQSAANGSMQRKEILTSPGTLGTAIWDFNGDGALDIVALVSQSDESLYMLTNRKKALEFDARRISQEQPGWGSNAMAMADMNGDGAPDLVVANGDNMDLLTRPLKNYHGVRVYQNNGRGSFSLQYTYPMYGATEILLRDFDHDGDIDILALAFYPEVKPNTETVVFIENRGKKGYLTHAMPASVPAGRWLVSASADINGDGDLDVLLTSANLMDRREREAFPSDPAYMLLENTSR